MLKLLVGFAIVMAVLCAMIIFRLFRFSDQDDNMDDDGGWK